MDTVIFDRAAHKAANQQVAKCSKKDCAKPVLLNNRWKSHKEVLEFIYGELKKKRYDPILQLTGFIIKDDYGFITNNNGARAVARFYPISVYRKELLGSNDMCISEEDIERKIEEYFS